MKRTFDIILSFLFLVILSPLFLIIAVLIKITMPGPVFFSQTRTGYKGKHFTIYKFRTMIVNTDPVVITVESDKRITAFGKFLRISKFDEFPQFWNILKGDMSFVGPRPDVPGYYDKLTGDDRIVLDVLPGLTGVDSVAYTYEEIILQHQNDPVKFYDKKLFPDKVRINKAYVKKRSFLLDLKIMAFTLLGKQFKDKDFQPGFNIGKKKGNSKIIAEHG